MIEKTTPDPGKPAPESLPPIKTRKRRTSPDVPQGLGDLFIPPRLSLDPMPEKPSLVDFFNLRITPANHLLQSAALAVQAGHSEETILACMLHDIAMTIVKTDHGWWGAQLVEPYVTERISWAIRYHQALRFYPDPSVGYEYPDLYIEIFGNNYKPEPHIQAAYAYARKHRWYMKARLITLHDEYAFDENAQVSIEPFIDIIGRHFKQPKEGLGNDNSPSAHMWRTIANPERPL